MPEGAAPGPPAKPGEGKAIAEDARATGDPKVSFDALRRENLKSDIGLKAMYARWMLRLLAAQILVADLGFFLYGFLGVEWEIDAPVMHVWLVSTVVEVVGVVFVISRYLFPRRDDQPGDAVTA